MKLKRISTNETEIKLNEETTVFFSYDTPVAAKVGIKYYRTEEKHSRTTSKHLNRWLEDVKCELKPQKWFEIDDFTPVLKGVLIERMFKS